MAKALFYNTSTSKQKHVSILLTLVVLVPALFHVIGTIVQHGCIIAFVCHCKERSCLGYPHCCFNLSFRLLNIYRIDTLTLCRESIWYIELFPTSGHLTHFEARITRDRWVRLKRVYPSLTAETKAGKFVTTLSRPRPSSLVHWRQFAYRSESDSNL